MRWLICVLLLSASCGQQSNLSSLEGLGATGNGKNVAILVGAVNGLPGVGTDIRELKRVFDDESYGFRFKATAAGDATKRQIMDLTAAESKDADSVFWFFSGHGNDDIMLASDTTFHFSEVAAAIKQARGGKPLKRLVVMIDSCHSGSFVDGENPIITEDQWSAATEGWANDAIYKPMTEANSLYEQAFVMAASKKDENSADLGAAKGGAFTYSLRTTLASLKINNPVAKFSDLATATVSLTQVEGGHTPVYKAFPRAEVINDYLFLYEMDAR